MVRCTNCYETISDDADICPKCGTKKPFDAIVIINWIDSQLYDIRSSLAIYYKKGPFVVKGRGVYEAGDIISLIVVSCVFYWLVQGFWHFDILGFLSNNNLIVEVILTGEQVEKYSENVYGAFLIAIVMYILFILAPIKRKKYHDYRLEMYHENNSLIFGGPNSFRRALSGGGYIIDRYKNALMNDKKILDVDGFIPSKTFGSYVSFYEQDRQVNDPMGRVGLKILNIKKLLSVSDEKYLVGIDVDVEGIQNPILREIYPFYFSVKDFFLYAIKHGNLFYLVFTGIVSIFLSSIYVYVTDIGDYSILLGVLIVSIIAQLIIFDARRQADSFIYLLVSRIEEQLFEVSAAIREENKC
ncbi:MAG: zinc ribbon domain-containing protein [Candidatus Electrothrix sp. AR3]|nr:zinc ribbon domain-containing protein [Candidatus Electrothrix sp. AR3]